MKSGDVKREWFDNDYYAALGVASSASQKEITKAYRALARKYHPDTNPDNAAAEERFKTVSAAYEVVGDEATRAQYDQVRQMGPMGGAFGGGGAGGFQGGADINDLLGSFLGGSGLFGQQAGGQRTRPREQRGRDQEARLVITFEESIRGTKASISVADTEGPRSMTVRIPAGVEDGQRIRLRGKGGPGTPAGDLFVTVNVGPNPLFTRSGSRLLLELPVTFAEAALGTDVDVPSFDGDSVRVRIPAGTQHGRILRIRGAGAAESEDFADLYVSVQLVVPEELTTEQRELLHSMAQLDDTSIRQHLDGTPS